MLRKVMAAWTEFWLIAVLFSFDPAAHAAPSFTVNPDQSGIARKQTVFATGSGTSWTSATTFTVSGGKAPSISEVHVNAKTQVATFILAPGATAARLTVRDSADSASATVVVAPHVTFTGSNLTSYTASPSYYFDPRNEFTQNASGHFITISGGIGFTAGVYSVANVQFGRNCGAQGFHNIVQLFATTTPFKANPAQGAASGGSWSWTEGSGGNGYSGNNLTTWSQGGLTCYFDPDAPIASGMNGATLTVSGMGWTSNTWTVTDYTGPFNTGVQSIQGIIYVAAIDGAHPASSIPSTGGEWSKNGGTIIPTPAVFPLFAGPIRLCLIGDSITARQTNSTANALKTAYPNASSIVCLNAGYGGTLASSWLPSDTTTQKQLKGLTGDPPNIFNTTVTLMNSNRITVASIMLGTNDAARGVAQEIHTANIQTIVTALFAHVPTLKVVVLEEQPAYGGRYASNNSVLHSYFTSYSSVHGARVGFNSTSTATVTNYEFFLLNPQDLADGLHPTGSGGAEINYTWLTSLASSFVTANNPAPGN